MSHANIIIWFLLIAILGFCAYWHFRENKALTIRWQRDLDTPSAAWLSRFAWSRTLQLLSVLFCAVLIIILYDWQLTEARQEIMELTQKQVSYENAIKPPIQTQPVSPITATQQQVQPPSSPQAEAIEPPSATPSPTQPSISAPTASASAAETVVDLYSPEKGAHDKQGAMDDLKKRYEDILVIHMVLKKCSRVNPTDYPIIMSALAQEMASINAPGRLQYDILTAAQGSYKEMYANSTCSGPAIDTLYNQYLDYIKALSQNTQGQ